MSAPRKRLTELEDVYLASHILTAAICDEPVSRGELEHVAGVFEHVVRELTALRTQQRTLRRLLTP